MPTQEQTRTALERAVATLTRKPSVGQRVYTSKAHIPSGTTCEVTEKGATIIADIPPSMGGDDGGPSPSILLRASITSCVAIGIKMWAARKEVPIGPLTVSLETDVDARGQFGICDDVPAGFTGMRAKIDLYSDAPRQQVEEVIHTSLRYSPLVELLGGPAALPVNITIEKELIYA